MISPRLTRKTVECESAGISGRFSFKTRHNQDQPVVLKSRNGRCRSLGVGLRKIWIAFWERSVQNSPQYLGMVNGFFHEHASFASVSCHAENFCVSAF